MKAMYGIIVSHSNTEKFALDTGYLIGIPGNNVGNMSGLVGENVVKKRVQKETTGVAFVVQHF